MRRNNTLSWRIIEAKLMRYPESKREYKEYIEDIMASFGGSSRPDDPTRERNKAQSVTEAKALKITSSYADRMKKEIDAVELVYNELRPEEQTVIRIRYWSQGIRKPVPYHKLTACSYSDRQMQRIVRRVIVKVGRYLGEIK